MSTLYVRCSLRQAKLLRMVEGAVKNTADAHKGWFTYSPRLGRSIAKRAVGTLTAAWPEVLALPQQAASESAKGGSTGSSGAASATELCKSARWGRGHRFRDRASLRRVHKELSARAGDLRRSGQTERLTGIIEALRLIAVELDR